MTARRHPLRLRGRGRARRAPPHHQLWGRGGRGRPGVAPRHSPPSPKAHTTGAGRTHTAPHLPDARRGPAGPSPDSEGGGAGRGRQRAAHGPTAGPAHPTPSSPTEGGGVLLCPRALAVATVATAHSGGAAAGGSGTPRLPLGSLEKAFSPRARRPSPGPSRLRAHGGAPRATRPQLGGRGLRYRWADHHTGACARSAPERSPRPAPCKASSAKASATRGNRHASPYRLDPPPKERHSGDTHATVAGTRGGHRVKGNDITTRPQAPEGRPGPLQGHHRGSHEARSHTRVGCAARRRQHSPPRHRESRSPGRRREGEARAICGVRRPTAPTDAPRQRTGDRRSGPEATPNPCLPPHPPCWAAGGGGEKASEGPRGQTEKSGRVHWERPSLVWHGLGSARENTTTPHRSVEPRWSGGRHGEDSHQRGPL